MKQPFSVPDAPSVRFPLELTRKVYYNHGTPQIVLYILDFNKGIYSITKEIHTVIAEDRIDIESHQAAFPEAYFKTHTAEQLQSDINKEIPWFNYDLAKDGTIRKLFSQNHCEF